MSPLITRIETATILDLAKAELKASRICRKWPNLALSKQYQLRAVALYLLFRRVRGQPDVRRTTQITPAPTGRLRARLAMIADIAEGSGTINSLPTSQR